MTRKELKEYNDLVSKYNELYKENKELKKQLNGINEERTYLYNKLSAENEQLNSLVNSCQEEIRRLKKQLENMRKLGLSKIGLVKRWGKIDKEIIGVSDENKTTI